MPTKIQIPRTKIGMLALDVINKEVGTKIKKIAHDHNVSTQTVIRLILEKFIDDIIFE